MEKSLFSLLSVNVNELPKASFAQITYYTNESKLTKADKAIIGCSVVEKRTSLNNVQLCYSFESAVNRHIDAIVGKSADDYKASAPKGMHWVKYPLILESDKEQGKYYLRMYLCKNTKSEKTYFCDGKEATQEQLAKITEILAAKPKYGSAKQAAAGLSEEEQVKPQATAFENIIELHAFGDTYKGQGGKQAQLA